jgi:fatty-acyl-CoA synthase
MLYSSGTTGTPKAVMVPLSGNPPGGHNVISPILESRLGFTSGSVYLSPAPLYHAAPLSFSTTTQRLGGTVVVMSKFNPERVLALTERYRVTHAQFVPTMFSRLLRLPEAVRNAYDISSLTAVLHAAAPCPVEVKQRMLKWWGPIIFEYYAGTEGAGITFCTPSEWLERPGTVGRAIFGQLHIVNDESGSEVPPGVIGTVRFTGGHKFIYRGDPDKTAAAYDAHGRSTIGDLGYVDNDGYLFLTGRLADTIIAGGVNIYPREVEDVIGLHPAVADVAVFGIPNEDLGEEVVAVVQLIDDSCDHDEVAAQLLEHCYSQLAHYKCPRTIDFSSEFPRAESGKLYKNELRQRYLVGADGVDPHIQPAPGAP